MRPRVPGLRWWIIAMICLVLLIDLIDSKTYKLLKRNYGSRPLLRDITPETRAARIQEVVDEILADLQIKG